MSRMRGLTELVHDAVLHGTAAVEKVHQSVARTPLEVIAAVPPLAAASRALADLQSRLIARTYDTIRETSASVAAMVAALLDASERARRP